MLKLSRRAAILPDAEDTIDRHFARLIAQDIGPLGALHALKRVQALAGGGPLVDGDRDAILARAEEQDARLAEIDQQRRDMKSKVRTAGSAAEIYEILAALG